MQRFVSQHMKEKLIFLFYAYWNKVYESKTFLNVHSSAHSERTSLNSTSFSRFNCFLKNCSFMLPNAYKIDSYTKNTYMYKSIHYRCFQNYAATHRQNSRRENCNGLPSIKQKFYLDTFKFQSNRF